MISHNVPFMGNSRDDTHCLQASYMMIRHFFEPDTLMGMGDEWDAITGYVPGKGTWQMAGLLWFQQNGYDVEHVSSFDYNKFASIGEKYLIQVYGEERGRWTIDYALDMAAERTRLQKFSQSTIWKRRTPTLRDIYNYLDEGYLLQCLVNQHVLNGRPGFLGHAVVVTGYTDTEIILHDPGLPPRPNRHVPVEQFLLAWLQPTTNAEKIDAIRKRVPATQKLIHAHDAASSSGPMPTVVA